MPEMKRDKITPAHVVSCAYILIQILVLFFLRKMFLMTVYQTVAAYAAVSLAGLAFLLAPYFVMSPGFKKWIEILWDYYLLFWSGVHAVIVLGFLTCGSYYLTLTQVTLVQIVNIFLALFCIGFISDSWQSFRGCWLWKYDYRNHGNHQLLSGQI